MRYVIDIDGVLCRNGSYENYYNAIPIMDNIHKVDQIRNSGHKIILHTSRKTKDAKITKDWLSRYNVVYDEIIFNKPQADFYIDDKAQTFLPNLSATINRKKLVICYSGGMDSLIAYYYAIKELQYKNEDILLLNFDINSNYSDKEKQARSFIGLYYETVKLGIIQDVFGNVPTKDFYIIPGRNLIFSSIASGYGDKVWIVGVKFENHPLMFDKNDDFYRIATAACSQAVGKNTIVESPFNNMSKTDILMWAKSNGVMNQVRKTVSCYHDSLFRCGDCGLCFKRAVAMVASGNREELVDYSVNPFTSKTANTFINLYKQALLNNDFTHYEKERIEETFNVLNVMGINY